MNYPSGSIYQIFAILDCLNEPRSQTEISRVAKVATRNMLIYIKIMHKLSFISPLRNALSATSYGIGWKKIWEITPKGIEFKHAIGVYVKA